VLFLKVGPVDMRACMALKRGDVEWLSRENLMSRPQFTIYGMNCIGVTQRRLLAQISNVVNMLSLERCCFSGCVLKITAGSGEAKANTSRDNRLWIHHIPASSFEIPFCPRVHLSFLCLGLRRRWSVRLLPGVGVMDGVESGEYGRFDDRIHHIK